jgi:hypothetical protein
MRGEEVEAQLMDPSGHAFEVSKRPSGLLVEVGGSLGTSVNADFAFADAEKTPESLLVSHRDQTVRFRIRHVPP